MFIIDTPSFSKTLNIRLKRIHPFMPNLIAICFLSITILSPILSAQNSDNQLTTTTLAASPIEAYNEKFKAINEYLKIVKPSSFIPNSGQSKEKLYGLSKYFDDVLENSPSLKTLTINFYEDVFYQTTDIDDIRCDLQNTCPSINLMPNPNFTDKLGENELHELKAGWVWQLAMKHSKNNPNLAMFLIGILGHDPEKSMWLVHPNSGISFGLLTTTSFFHTESLGPNITISEKLKSEIIHYNSYLLPYYLKEQSKTSLNIDNKNTIANIANMAHLMNTKYYHVYTSAFLACALKEFKIEDSFIINFQKRVSRTYRTSIACENKYNLLSFLNTLTNIINSYHRNIKSNTPSFSFQRLNLEYKTKSYFENLPQYLLELHNKCIDQSSANNEQSELCDKYLEIFDSNFNFYLNFSGKITLEESKEAVSYIAEKYYTKQFFELFYICNHDIKYLDIPFEYTNVLGTMKEFEEYTNEQLTRILKQVINVPDNYLTNVINNIRLFSIDIMWTESQHEVGAHFAINNCQPGGYKDIEIHAKEALK